MGLFMCNSPILIQSGLRPPALPPKSASPNVLHTRIFLCCFPSFKKRPEAARTSAKVCKSQRLAHADLFMLFPMIQKAA